VARSDRDGIRTGHGSRSLTCGCIERCMTMDRARARGRSERQRRRLLIRVGTGAKRWVEVRRAVIAAWSKGWPGKRLRLSQRLIR